MKRMCVMLVLFVVLSGCENANKAMDRALSFRSSILQSNGCEFIATVTADYEDVVHTFKMLCSADGTGGIRFEVLAPESISGITGQLSAEGGKLLFDDNVLLFSLLADGRYSPLCAPWITLRAIRSGYIRGCGNSSDGIEMVLDDSYNDDALEVIVRLSDMLAPVSAEIYCKGNRILTMIIEEFKFL